MIFLIICIPTIYAYEFSNPSLPSISQADSKRLSFLQLTDTPDYYSDGMCLVSTATGIGYQNCANGTSSSGTADFTNVAFKNESNDFTKNNYFSSGYMEVNGTNSLLMIRSNDTEKNVSLRLSERPTDWQGGYVHYDGVLNLLKIGTHNNQDALFSSDINQIVMARDGSNIRITPVIINFSSDGSVIYIGGTAIGGNIYFGQSSANKIAFSNSEFGFYTTQTKGFNFWNNVNISGNLTIKEDIISNGNITSDESFIGDGSRLYNVNASLNFTISLAITEKIKNNKLRAIVYHDASNTTRKIEIYHDVNLDDYSNASEVGSIQWAINQMCSEGGEISIMNGNYTISYPIIIDCDWITIHGNVKPFWSDYVGAYPIHQGVGKPGGAKITAMTTMDSVLTVGTNTSLMHGDTRHKGIAFRSLYVDGNNMANYGIRDATFTDVSEVSDCLIQGTNKSGISVGWDAGKIFGNSIQDNNGDGIQIVPNGVFDPPGNIMMNIIYDNGGTCINLTASKYIVTENSVSCKRKGIYLGENTDSINVNANYVPMNTTDGIYDESSYNIVYGNYDQRESNSFYVKHDIETPATINGSVGLFGTLGSSTGKIRIWGDNITANFIGSVSSLVNKVFTKEICDDGGCLNVTQLRQAMRKCGEIKYTNETETDSCWALASDLAGNVIVVAGNATDGQNYSVGWFNGSSEYTLNNSQMPFHNHSIPGTIMTDISYTTATTSGAGVAVVKNPITESKAVAPTGAWTDGGGLAFDNRQAFVVMNAYRWRCGC